MITCKLKEKGNLIALFINTFIKYTYIICMLYGMYLLTIDTNKWNSISVEVLVKNKGCRCALKIAEARTNKININIHTFTCTHKNPNETIFILWKQ